MLQVSLIKEEGLAIQRCVGLAASLWIRKPYSLCAFTKSVSVTDIYLYDTHMEEVGNGTILIPLKYIRIRIQKRVCLPEVE